MRIKVRMDWLLRVCSGREWNNDRLIESGSLPFEVARVVAGT